MHNYTIEPNAPASSCGKCYVVKSTKTGKMACVMGIDGTGGVKQGASPCSPEMTVAVGDQIFGAGVISSGRGDFKYMPLDKCPGV